MISQDLLALLCCPETRQPLILADQELVNALNRAIEAGQVKNSGNKPVTQLLDGALIREDRRVIYPVRQDIPMLLADEAISLERIDHK